ncbi:MAG: multicopper oxidase domain-containing protein, partial [Candidatus Phosphoribacter sp.]
TAPTQPAGARTQRPGRGVWRWRDYPSLAWLLLAALSTTVHPFLSHGRWLMVHLVLLGALTHAAMVWSTHFAEALLKTTPDLDARRRQSIRLALLFVGVSLTLVGVVAERWPLAVLGASLVSLAVLWHAVMLWRRLRRSLAPRFRVTVHYYLVAAASVPVGATLGVLLARGPDDDWKGRLLVGHTVVMALGWIGLTVTGTLVTLWPTMLRTRLDPRAESLARRSLPLLSGSVAVVLGGALVGSRWVAVGGLIAYAAALLWWGRALWVPARTQPPRQMSTLSVAAALGWALVAVGWVTGTVALRADWAEMGDTYGVPAAVLAGGFAPQLLIGALSHLVPTILGGGPTAVRSAQEQTDRWALLRLVLVNVGLALSLMPVSGWVRVALTSLVLAAYLASVPLLGLAIRASLRARREAEARRGVGGSGRWHRSVWSGGQLVVGLSAIALVVAVGVLVDPRAAGFLVASGGGGPAVAASGTTTTVRVEARTMHFEPSVVTVPVGDRLVLELVNTDPTTTHDLLMSNGSQTQRLRPGASERLDVGTVGGAMDGWCTVVGHRQMGMVLTVVVTGTPAGADAAAAAHGPGAGHGTASPEAPSSAPNLATRPGADFTAVSPVLAPAPSGTEHHVTLTVQERDLQVAPGVWQRRWTYNGAVPGPVLRGTVGDTFVVTLVNDGTIGHSVDFHAGSLAPDRPMRTIPPGESLEYRFTATRSGIWMYHCSTMPMSSHIAAGMYGVVIIDPADLPRADREYVLVQSEVYLGPGWAAAAPSEVDVAKVSGERPDAVVFNGVANQYDHRPLTAKVGERVRIWVLDAGPNRPTSFHVVGGQFDRVYAEGSWLLRAAPGDPQAGAGSQVLALAPAQGGFVEMAFSEAGNYPLVSHLMVDGERGAHGLIEVGP